MTEIPSPTPAEIRERCRQIRAEWSPYVERRRAGSYGATPVEIPRSCQRGDEVLIESDGQIMRRLLWTDDDSFAVMLKERHKRVKG